MEVRLLLATLVAAARYGCPHQDRSHGRPGRTGNRSRASCPEQRTGYRIRDIAQWEERSLREREAACSIRAVPTGKTRRRARSLTRRPDLQPDHSGLAGRVRRGDQAGHGRGRDPARPLHHRLRGAALPRDSPGVGACRSTLLTTGEGTPTRITPSAPPGGRGKSPPVRPGWLVVGGAGRRSSPGGLTAGHRRLRRPQREGRGAPDQMDAARDRRRRWVRRSETWVHR